MICFLAVSVFASLLPLLSFGPRFSLSQRNLVAIEENKRNFWGRPSSWLKERGLGKVFLLLLFVLADQLPAEGEEMGRKWQRFLLPRKKDDLQTKAAGHFNSIKHVVQTQISDFIFNCSYCPSSKPPSLDWKMWHTMVMNSIIPRPHLCRSCCPCGGYSQSGRNSSSHRCSYGSNGHRTAPRPPALCTRPHLWGQAQPLSQSIHVG